MDEGVHATAVHGRARASLAGSPAVRELAIALVGEGLSRLSALLESLLGDLFANRTSVQLMQHAATLDLEQFEDAEIYDKLERARRQTVGRIGLFTMLLATLQDLITWFAQRRARSVLPGSWAPIVPCFPSLLGETHFASLATLCSTLDPPSAGSWITPLLGATTSRQGSSSSACRTSW